MNTTHIPSLRFHIPIASFWIRSIISSYVLFTPSFIAAFSARPPHSIHQQFQSPTKQKTHHHDTTHFSIPSQILVSSSSNSNQESENFFFAIPKPNKNRKKLLREEVKEFTSDLIAPLAVDEEELQEYCDLVTGEANCLSPSSSSSIGFNGDESKDNIFSIANSGNDIYDDIVYFKGGNLTEIIDSSIQYIPFIAPICAFLTYDYVVAIFNYVIDLIANNNWQSVDGRSFQVQTLIPAINGIIVPAVSILFATLSSTTITTLRQRQLDIRTSLNMESNEIRALQSLIESYPRSTSQEYDFEDKCRAYLIQYTARIISESQPEVALNSLEYKGSMDSEMNGFIAQLNEMASRPDAPPDTILGQSYGAISRLNSYRSTRISALESTFPMLHFLIVFALGGSICVAFLMETSQEILIFLNAVQLRMLWTILIGTLTSLGVVCYDLLEPFRGSYQIASSIDQLYTIREVLRASDRLKKYKMLQKEYNEKKSNEITPKTS